MDIVTFDSICSMTLEPSCCQSSHQIIPDERVKKQKETEELPSIDSQNSWQETPLDKNEKQTFFAGIPYVTYVFFSVQHFLQRLIKA